jgi:hypothetical protein
MEQTSVYGVIYDKKKENAKLKSQRSNYLIVMSYAAIKCTAFLLEFYLNYILNNSIIPVNF